MTEKLSTNHSSIHDIPHETKSGLTSEHEIALSHSLEGGRLAKAQLYGTNTTEPVAHTDPDVISLLEEQVEEAKKSRDTLVVANIALADWATKASLGLEATHFHGKGTFSQLRQRRSPHALPEDRFQEARLGLIKAAQRYEAFPVDKKTGKRMTEPVKFSTFALWTIQGHIQRFIYEQENTGLRIPEYVETDIRKSQKDPSKFSNQELEDFDLWLMRRRRIANANATTGRTISEEQEDSWSEAPQLTIEDVAGNSDEEFDPHYATWSTQRTKAINDVLASLMTIDPTLSAKMIERTRKLKENQDTCLRLYFGLNGDPALSYRKIGERLKISGERVRQIINRGVDAIKDNPEHIQTLKIYFDDHDSDIEATPLGRHELLRTEGFINVKTMDSIGLQQEPMFDQE